jgi:hypothetical protein
MHLPVLNPKSLMEFFFFNFIKRCKADLYMCNRVHVKSIKLAYYKNMFSVGYGLNSPYSISHFLTSISSFLCSH